MSWRFHHCVVAAGLAGFLGMRPTAAELNPSWSARFPVGAALTAGLKGLVVDADGVAYVTGINGPSSNTDAVTAAYAPDGTLLWSHVYNGPQNGHDQSRGICLGPGGVLYVVGNTPGPGMYANVLLLKYDAATGTLLNTVQYSNGGGLSEHGAIVVTDGAGDVYVGGGTVGDGSDCLIMKFTPGGQLVWQKVWDGPASAPYSQDVVQRLLMDLDSNPTVLIHGVVNSQHPDYVLVKYAAQDGAIIWQMNWGVSGGDFPKDMKMDADGDFYVTGTGIDVINRFSTIKVRGSDGALLWQRYDSIGLREAAAAVALDGQGGVYITGSSDPDGNQSNFNDNFYTVKRDAASGDLLWTHFYGANCVGCYDVPRDVLVDSAGRVFVVGRTSSAPYNNDMILFLLDRQSGVEVDRGSVDGGPIDTLTGDVMRLGPDDALYAGGEYYNVNTGAVDMALFQYAGQAAARGDLNCDGAVDFDDVDPFVVALSDPDAYEAQYPGCSIANGDCNGDGTVDFNDIDPFVELLGAR